MSTPAATGRPIRLVYRDENGKFQMDEDAVSFLMDIEEPIGVVSVCGPACQGKSFILNQLLCGSSSGSGFKVDSSLYRCTKGLWVWSSPIRTTAEDGTEYSLLLMDSEAISQSLEIYFYLAVHLSSMLIYNQMGFIDDSALSHLSLVTKLAEKHTSCVSDSAASNPGQTSPPTFVWLLRDFCLNMVNHNDKRISPSEYLELALMPSPEDAPVINKIRESIRALFPNRNCFALVRPVTKEADLDKIPTDKRKPQFTSALNGFVKFVTETTKPKCVQGKLMTGPLFVIFAQSFLDAYNNGVVPPSPMQVY